MCWGEAPVKGTGKLLCCSAFGLGAVPGEANHASAGYVTRWRAS